MRIENIGGCFKKFLCIAMVAGLLGSPVAIAGKEDNEKELPKISWVGENPICNINCPSTEQDRTWYIQLEEHVDFPMRPTGPVLLSTIVSEDGSVAETIWTEIYSGWCGQTDSSRGEVIYSGVVLPSSDAQGIKASVDLQSNTRETTTKCIVECMSIPLAIVDKLKKKVTRLHMLDLLCKHSEQYQGAVWERGS